jgi:hypothetical protein
MNSHLWLLWLFTATMHVPFSCSTHCDVHFLRLVPAEKYRNCTVLLSFIVAQLWLCAPRLPARVTECCSVRKISRQINMRKSLASRENFSGDGKLRLFCDALARALLHSLSGRVLLSRSRSSSWLYFMWEREKICAVLFIVITLHGVRDCRLAKHAALHDVSNIEIVLGNIMHHQIIWIYSYRSQYWERTFCLAETAQVRGFSSFIEWNAACVNIYVSFVSVLVLHSVWLGVVF